MNTLRSAARNISIVAVSQLLMWVATFVFTIAQAHLLGPARFGSLSLALSYAVILGFVVDFGLGIHLSRIVAQRSGGVEALGATIVARSAIWAVAVPLLWLATIVFAYDRELQGTILVLAVSALFVGISTAIEAFLRGQERFLLPSVASVVYRLTAAAVGIVVLVLGQSLVGVAWAFLLGAIANLAVLLVGVSARSWIKARLDPRMAWSLFRAAIPLGMFWIMGTFSFNVDMVILERLLPRENVGWYAAAYRLFIVATIFPTIVAGMVLSPVLARLSLGPRDELRTLLEKMLTVLIISGVAVSLVLGLFAERIVSILYPAEAYWPAANALRLLAPRLLFVYVNSVFMYTLIALHQERRLVVMAATLAILTPLGNLLAVPMLQQEGAALVGSLTELAWLIWNVRLMPKDLLSGASVRIAAKAGLAAIPAALVGALAPERSLLITLPLVLATYAGAALALRIVRPSDLQALRALASGLRSAAPERMTTIRRSAREEVA